MDNELYLSEREFELWEVGVERVEGWKFHFGGEGGGISSWWKGRGRAGMKNRLKWMCEVGIK